MAFAPVQSQALVISNSVVSTMNIKATVYYVNDKNKVVKISVSNKDILKYDGAPKGAKLADWEGDAVIISDNAIWEDLTVDGVLYVSTDEYSDNEIDGNNDSYKYADTGTVEVEYGSDGYIPYYGDSIGDNDYGFDVTGVYTDSGSGSAVKSGYQTESDKFSASSLAGEAYDYEVGYVPVTATASGSGSGKVLY